MTGIQGGLEGITVAAPVTRRAEETARLISRWGGIPLVAPVMVEVERDDLELRAATERVCSGVDIAVHLTGTGTGRWFERAPAWGLLEELLAALRNAEIVARGPKTSVVLRRWGLTPAWSPASETSSEIASVIGPRVGPGVTVAVQEYGRPAGGLSAALERAGAEVVEVEPYHWALPPDTGPARALVREIVSGRVDALVLTSAPQLAHLYEVARGLRLDRKLEAALAGRVFVAAVGRVAAAGAAELGVRCDLVPERARLGTLVRELAARRDRILERRGTGGPGT